jgi:hypothetical protein
LLYGRFCLNPCPRTRRALHLNTSSVCAQIPGPAKHDGSTEEKKPFILFNSGSGRLEDPREKVILGSITPPDGTDWETLVEQLESHHFPGDDASTLLLGDGDTTGFLTIEPPTGSGPGGTILKDDWSGVTLTTPTVNGNGGTVQIKMVNLDGDAAGTKELLRLNTLGQCAPPPLPARTRARVRLRPTNRTRSHPRGCSPPPPRRPAPASFRRPCAARRAPGSCRWATSPQRRRRIARWAARA